jgi:hypothetical protein
MNGTVTLSKIREAAQAKGLGVIERPNGHIQFIGGHLLVNYYPFSRRRAAYIAGTTKKFDNVSIEQAVAMALKPPPVADHSRKQERRGNYRSNRRRLIDKDPHCYWCRCVLNLDTSTMDHVIPLGRGGLDNANNRVLACESCNNKRGSDMPEIER